MNRRIRTYGDVADGPSDLADQVREQRARLEDRLAGVGSIIVVASGKGGVGKSLVAASTAAALASRGARVGALDADVNGPSLARMLGVMRTPLQVRARSVQPAAGAAGVRVMSTDLLLAEPDTPVQWREPAEGGFVWQSTLETGVVREFLADVEWGQLDFLVVDLPPGTDRIARLLGLVPAPAALLLVTTPSRAATDVVARSIRYARAAGVPRLGLVANMTGITCTACGAVTPLFQGAGGAGLAERYAVPLWADIPFDAELAATTDAGDPLVLRAPDSPAARALRALADRVAVELRPDLVAP